jgi:hypothetical protein
MTYHAVAAIRESMAYFRWSLLLVALAALVAAASAPATGVGNLIGVPGHPPSLDNATVSRLVNQSGGLQAVAVLSGLFAVAGLVLELVAYLKWREGAKTVEGAGWEYGARHLTEARAANRDRRWAFGAFLVQFLVALVVAAVIFDIAFQVAESHVSGGIPLSPDQFSALQSELQGAFFASVIASWLTNLFLYFFASRSLTRTLEGIVPEEQRAILRQGRFAMIFGTGLSLLGLLALYSPYGSLVGVVPPLVVALGVTWVIQGYDAWLERPPPLTPIGYAPGFST